MARVGRFHAALIALALAGGNAAGQDARLALRLAPDPTHAGPAAWTQVRDQALRALTGDALDPFAGIVLAFDGNAKLRVEPDHEALGDAYLRFELIVDGRKLVSGEGDRHGREAWLVHANLPWTALPAPVRSLCERFAFEATTGWLTFDLPTAVGNLMAAGTEGDLISETLSLCTAECGSVALFARVADDGAWRVEGRSGAGLVLPALLLTLADFQAGRFGNAARVPLADDLDRWLLLAASAVQEEQEEAARQLGRFRDPRAIRTLERLLFGSATLRELAMWGLVRQRSVRSLGAIVAAADARHPGTVALAAQAVWTLAPAPVAEAILATLPRTSATSVAPPGAMPIPSAWVEPLLAVLLAIALSCAIALVVLQRRYAAGGAARVRRATVAPSPP